MKRLKTVIFIFILFFMCIGISRICYSISKYGSTGNEVKNIQTKLSELGYLTSSDVDGIFGSKTQNAVRKYQTDKGLKVDGIVGDETLKSLGLKSDDSSGGGVNNNTDLNLLSKLVYAEARGEPYNGMVAVAATVLNRVQDSKFPNSISGVIYQSGAFTCVDDGQINLDANSTAKKAAQDAINGWDPTSGSIYYFNPDTATSSWIWGRPQVLKIGKHIFCK